MASRPQGQQQKPTIDVFTQVPVLPVVIPIGVAALVGLLYSLHRRQRFSAPRAAVAVAVSVYVAGILANTVFPIFLDKPTGDASWTRSLYLVPLSGYELGDALMNIAVFLPVGILVPLVLPRPSWGRVLVVTAASTLAIEVTQYITGNLLGGGHLADINDLIFNITGGAVGMGLYRLLSRVRVLDRFIDRFRWRTTDRAEAMTAR